MVRTGSPARVLNWMERGRAAALLAVEPPEFDAISADLTALRATHAACGGADEALDVSPAGPAAARARRAVES